MESGIPKANRGWAIPGDLRLSKAFPRVQIWIGNGPFQANICDKERWSVGRELLDHGLRHIERNEKERRMSLVSSQHIVFKSAHSRPTVKIFSQDRR